MDLIIILFVIMGIAFLPKFISYNRSDYKNASNNSFWDVVFNKGNYGEFLIFKNLEGLEGYHKFLTNLYIPKHDGTTTEIDLVMISETGIYVFESKNYSGWIFGDEKYKNWVQTFPNKQKNYFYNPIWQNKGHIKALKSVLDLDNDYMYKSYIVFSERCTLKRITITSPNVVVIKRSVFQETIKQEIGMAPDLFSISDINMIYSRLHEYSRADMSIRNSHIQNIKR